MMNQTFTNGKWLEITKHQLKTACLGFQAYLSHEELTQNSNPIVLFGEWKVMRPNHHVG